MFFEECYKLSFGINMINVYLMMFCICVQNPSIIVLFICQIVKNIVCLLTIV